MSPEPSGETGRLSFEPAEAVALAARGNVIPLVCELPADLLTPVGAFLRIAADREHAFLLESVEGGDRVGRYSFLGCDPVMTIERDHLPPAGITPERPRASGRREAGAGEDGFDALRSAAAQFRPVRMPDLPPFTGGFVGRLAYDAVRSLERLPGGGRDDLGTPDLHAALYDTVVAFDRARQRIQIVANLLPGRNDRGVADEYRRAAQRIAEIVERLQGPLPAARSADSARMGPLSGGPVTATLDDRAFETLVLAAKEEIARGEIIQVVLSRRLERPFAGDPFSVYRALRTINPSPYHFYLKAGACVLAGASPEMLVRARDGRIETRPIAGTRRRSDDEAEDDRLAAELRADPKEMAEHLMLVDLGRNDLGRIAVPASVRVSRFAEVERYSHVMHLVSSVEARLREGHDAFDALLACFPAGTVSGAPKVRAMEIIDALEPTRRGPYAGCVFYRGFDGAIDSAIMIRVVLLQNGRAYVQSGAGIVADSDPAREFAETESKARAALAALERAAEIA